MGLNKTLPPDRIRDKQSLKDEKGRSVGVVWGRRTIEAALLERESQVLKQRDEVGTVALLNLFSVGVLMPIYWN